VTADSSANEDRFTILEAEWLSLTARFAASTVEGWEASLKSMTDESEHLRAAGSWQTGPADFLGVTGRSRHELTHSAMLGWLLDSSGRHGLGNRLVIGLLSHTGLPVGDSEYFVVRREITGHSARADLVLSNGQIKVVIENKLDAIEQPFQCERLADDHPDAQALIFLTPTGGAPLTALTQDRWHCIRWSLIAELLEQALEDSGSAPARHIAEDYLSTLRRELP
jgi:PD-(D/E)XK nuclease superfamily